MIDDVIVAIAKHGLDLKQHVSLDVQSHGRLLHCSAKGYPSNPTDSMHRSFPGLFE